MSKHKQYTVKIVWKGNTGAGTIDYNGYERTHEIIINNKKKIIGTSDSATKGDLKKHCPEDLFLSSLSSCHMLWYLHFCSLEGVIVIDYVDVAEGKMIQTSNGSGYFTEVILRPKIRIKQQTMLKKALELHKKANTFCFIANSINFPVYHKPEIIFEE